MNRELRELAEELRCGEDEECRRDLRELEGLVRELDSLASKLPKPFLTDAPQGGGPLISRVQNLEELRRSALSLVEGNEDLADYLVRRRLYLELGRELGRLATAPRDSPVCPVCGRRPRVVVLKRGETGLFAGHDAVARCTCGAEWPYNEWLCPSCRGMGRDNFEVYLFRSKERGETPVLEVRVCRKCGYKLAVVWGDVDQVDVAFINLILDSFNV